MLKRHTQGWQRVEGGCSDALIACKIAQRGQSSAEGVRHLSQSCSHSCQEAKCEKLVDNMERDCTLLRSAIEAAVRTVTDAQLPLL